MNDLAKFKRKYRHKVTIIFSVFILTLSIYNLSLSLHKKIIQNEVLGATNEIGKNEEYWLSVLNENPSYYPAIKELLIISIKENDLEGVIIYTNKIKDLNPNSLK